MGQTNLMDVPFLQYKKQTVVSLPQYKNQTVPVGCRTGLTRLLMRLRVCNGRWLGQSPRPSLKRSAPTREACPVGT